MGEHFAFVGGTEPREGNTDGVPPCLKVLYNSLHFGKYRGLNLPKLNYVLHISVMFSIQGSALLGFEVSMKKEQDVCFIAQSERSHAVSVVDCLSASPILAPIRQRKRQPSLSLNITDFVQGRKIYWVATAIGVVRPLAGLGSMDIKMP